MYIAGMYITPQISSHAGKVQASAYLIPQANPLVINHLVIAQAERAHYILLGRMKNLVLILFISVQV